MDQIVYQIPYSMIRICKALQTQDFAQGLLLDMTQKDSLFQGGTVSDPTVLSAIYKKCIGMDHFLSFLQKGNRHDEIWLIIH